MTRLAWLLLRSCWQSGRFGDSRLSAADQATRDSGSSLLNLVTSP
jgi:hypothetical protein